MKAVLPGGVASVSYRPFPPSGSVLLLPPCLVLAHLGQLVRVVVLYLPSASEGEVLDYTGSHSWIRSFHFIPNFYL